MYEPLNGILNGILNGMQEPSTFGFKILEAGASNTLIITTKDNIHPAFGIPIAIKVWIDRREDQKLIQEKAVEYEKKVYEGVIRHLFTEHKEPPFLKYLGSDDGGLNITTLSRFIGAEHRDCSTLLRLAFCVLNIFSNNPLLRKTFIDEGGVIDLMSKHFYINFFSRYDFTSQFSLIPLTIRLKGLLFPEIKFVKFSDIVGNPGVSLNIFREIIKGLYMINKKRLVHNDLHIGNVMIQRETGKVMIYDWDRAYCGDFEPNPILNTETSTGLCKYSQCNTFLEGRPIDLLKFLIYLTDATQEYFYYIIREGLRIPNIQVNLGGVSVRVYDLIYNGIKAGSPGGGENKFFIFNDKSSLYQVGLCKELEYAIICIGGTWDNIYNQAVHGIEPIQYEHRTTTDLTRYSPMETKDPDAMETTFTFGFGETDTNVIYSINKMQGEKSSVGYNKKWEKSSRGYKKGEISIKERKNSSPFNIVEDYNSEKSSIPIPMGNLKSIPEVSFSSILQENEIRKGEDYLKVFKPERRVG